MKSINTIIKNWKPKFPDFTFVDSEMFRLIKSDSEEDKLEAIKRNYNSIFFITNPSLECQHLAIKNSGYTLNVIWICKDWKEFRKEIKDSLTIKSKTGQYKVITYGKVSLSEVWPYVLATNEKGYLRPEKFPFQQWNLNTDSVRLRCFANNQSCVCCGLTGNIFLVQAHLPTETPHLNLHYENGDELIMLTKDHIIPRSKGGKDILANMQTMCFPCNMAKANASISLEELRVLRGLDKVGGVLTLAP